MLRRSLVATLLLSQAAVAAADPGRLGVSLDVGVPDGANAAAVYRPVRFLDLHAGVGTNLVSPGVRAGATLHMLPTMISPTLSVEGGHYFEGNANKTMMRLGLVEESDVAVLDRVGYDYANLHLGVHFGRSRVSVFLHAGWSIIRGTVHDLESSFESEESDGLSFEIREDPVITIITPSARLGVTVFL